VPFDDDDVEVVPLQCPNEGLGCAAATDHGDVDTLVDVPIVARWYGVGRGAGAGGVVCHARAYPASGDPNRGCRE
jgi:hypothetical protein